MWNIGWQPVRADLDRYLCRHGLGYTVIESAKDGLSATQECFVPNGDNCELARVTLKNESGQEKTVDLFSAVEFCLWNALDDMSNFQRNYNIGEVEVAGSRIYHKTEYRERRNHYAVFAVNAPITGFDTDRTAFCGAYRGFSDPETVFAGESKNSVAHGWQPIGSHHIRLTLAPGETKRYIFILGYCENPAEEKFSAPDVINKTPADRLCEQYATDAQFDAAFAALAAYWEHLLSRFTVCTGNEKLDRMVNVWNQYQCMVTFNMSRSASYFESGLGRGMGFRDSCQDLLGFVHLIPERARERILDVAATQFPDGSAYHQYQPLTKRGNSDVVQLYVKAEDTPLAPPNPALCGFARVHLDPGESKQIELAVSPAALTVVDEEGTRIFPGGRYSLYAGTSQPDARSRELTGNTPVKIELLL